MTATTAWAHLPNAKHIDWGLCSVKENPQAWGAARDAAWDAARDAERDSARGAALDAARDAARYAAWDAAWGAAWDAAWGAAWNAELDAARIAAWSAICALIAWDACAVLLDYTPAQLRTYYALSDDPAALLLLPAVIVRTGETP